MSALEKGTGFELKIAELFEKNGYYVTHNTKMKGKSGAEHQIDVFAEFKAPLHTSSIIIEAKSYQTNIDKDIIMKLISIQQDLSADRAILATTSDFTPGALKTANQYQNVELWNGEKLAKLLGKMQLMDTADITKGKKSSSTKMVNAICSIDEIKQYADEQVAKRAKGGFLGRGKIEEKVLGVEKFLYPYYDANMEASIRVVEKTGWRSKEEAIHTITSRTAVDGVTGALIHVTDSGVSYEYAYLNDLNENEIQFLELVPGLKEFEKRSVTFKGLSQLKIGQIINSLVGKGLLVQTNDRPACFKAVHEYPYDPSIFQSIIEDMQVSEFDSSDEKIDTNINPASIETAFSNFWAGCKVKDIVLVYYPYFGITYEKPDGTRRLEVLDGIQKIRQEYLEGVVDISVGK